MKLYQHIAQNLDIISRKPGTSWEVKARIRLNRLLEQLPSGSGFDSGCKLLEESTSQKLVFSADFHHMNDTGYYDGWTEHKVIVKPCLIYGFSMRITGRNRREIKEYIGDTFHHVLNGEVLCYETQI